MLALNLTVMPLVNGLSFVVGIDQCGARIRLIGPRPVVKWTFVYDRKMDRQHGGAGLRSELQSGSKLPNLAPPGLGDFEESVTVIRLSGDQVSF